MALQLTLLFLITIFTNGDSAFLPRRQTTGRNCFRCSGISSLSFRNFPDRLQTALLSVSIKSYEYDGWNLVYRFKPASPGYENSPPLLLVHPVGIGLSSWFWERFLDDYKGTAFAPNLIGCGISEGGDAWDPDEKGLFFPLGWVKEPSLFPSILDSQLLVWS